MEWKSFTNGMAFDAWTYFGAIPEEGRIIFRTYAPSAVRVTVTGEFNYWTETEMPQSLKGVFSCRADAKAGQMYKYIIYGKDGSRTEHCDPFGYETERGRGHCSIIRDLQSYTWHDSWWMEHRTLNFDRPMNIYEMHIGSWAKKMPGGWEWYNYDELAEPLIRYLRENGYTHVEFLPLAEHPADFSWGYQQTGPYSATSRYGSVNRLKFLVDHLHQEGFGVIFDFVSVHFATDAWGLRRYSGAPVFESSKVREQKSDWGSIYYDHSKPAVRSYLQSAADFWITQYHADGLRMDAVSHLIFRKGRYEKGENTEGLLFLRNMNQGLHARHPDVMLIAEDPTTYPKVTYPVEQGGLGFTYKWDMGWTYDTMSFFTTAPKNRPGKSYLLTNSTDWCCNEHYVLPFSHDNVAWHSGSLLSQMPGRMSSKLREYKLLQLYMAMHPGKKMNFMGNEFAVQESWNAGKSLDWNLLNTPAHKGMKKYMQTLNQMILNHRALHEADDQRWSCQWLSCDDHGNGVYALIRHSADDHICAIFNLSDQPRTHFIPLANASETELLLHTDSRTFGGKTSKRTESYHYENNGLHVSLPKLSAIVVKVNFHS